MPEHIAVLAEKIRTIEREMKELRGDVRENSHEIDVLDRTKETTIYKLEVIDKKLEDIQTSISKDSGWRGFFLDFIKAAAQIAVLVGAGKWIF